MILWTIFLILAAIFNNMYLLIFALSCFWDDCWWDKITLSDIFHKKDDEEQQ